MHLPKDNKMDASQASQLLGTSKPSQIAPNSPIVNALKSVGISENPDGKALATAQEKLLTVMEESQKAAGHSGALLKASDLGTFAENLTGELYLHPRYARYWPTLLEEVGALNKHPQTPSRRLMDAVALTV
jgi:hypothetical protein